MNNRRSFLKIAFGTLCGGVAISKIIAKGITPVVEVPKWTTQRNLSPLVAPKIKLFGATLPTHTANSFFTDARTGQSYIVSQCEHPSLLVEYPSFPPLSRSGDNNTNRFPQ